MSNEVADRLPGGAHRRLGPAHPRPSPAHPRPSPAHPRPGPAHPRPGPAHPRPGCDVSASRSGWRRRLLAWAGLTLIAALPGAAFELSGPDVGRIDNGLTPIALEGQAQSGAALDLSQAEVERLDNGLTLIVLEEHALPVVSVQMLYKIGARNEPSGKSGIAHFLEHMAFRASENFPDTGLVSSIYAVGGEWHGYTWLDQTTYFETLPAEHLDLALRIEADRMAGLLIPAEDVEAERGAVLAEMHGYENDPATVLKDAVLAVSFLQQPYRNNSIGWESDVRAIGHDDLVEFYRRHYRPANAVLAIVGNVSRSEVTRRVAELFGDLPAGPPTPTPPTVEPPQAGVRRVELQGGGRRHRFEVAYRAPAAVDPDFASFLVLQEVLAGGRGVNFAQNTFGDATRPGARLADVAEDLVTWYPPQAAPYVFTVAGSLAPERSRADLEEELEAAIAEIRDNGPTAAEVRAARERLADELVFDVETTEDAAHQLAYFEGLGGLDTLLGLPAAVAAVTALDVQRVARLYLQPWQRTIGWFLAGPGSEAPGADVQANTRRAQPAPLTTAATPPSPAAPPRVVTLAGGMPVLLQRLPLSPAAYLRILMPGTGFELTRPAAGMQATPDDPLWRHTSVDFRFRPEALAQTLQQAAAVVRSARVGGAVDPAAVEDPATRLSMALDERLGRLRSLTAPSITAIALVGDVDEAVALPLLETAFGDWTPASVEPMAPRVEPGEVQVDLAEPKAQAQLGYVAPAPAPADPDWLAYRALLYVLSHGYEGRLGKEAISRQGLIYYIDAGYTTDGGVGRVSLEMGVDPDKLDAMRVLLRRTLDGLRSSPPSATELAEARAYLVGRRVSGAQSNEEVSASLLEDWVGHGRLLTPAAFEAAVEAVTAADVERILPSFLAGATVVIGVNDATPTASHIFTGGPIQSIDGRAADAVAIGDGRILAVGSRADTDIYRGPDTVEVDLAGRALAPAFVDHHVHLLNLGLSLLYAAAPSPGFIDLSGLSSKDDIAAAVAERAALLPAGSWILGQGWSQGAWGEAELPDHALLSAAAPDHPVYLTRVDGHAGWLNAEAMRRAGIDAATPDPAGGAIVRAADGAPSGVLLERANELLRPWLPEPSDAQVRRAFRLAAEALAAQGVCEVFDAGFLGPPGIVDLELDLERYLGLLVAEDLERPLPLRVNLMVPAPSALAEAVSVAPEAYRQLSPRVRVTHFKLFADGALGSRGALLSHSYADEPGTNGVERMTAAELLAVAGEAVDAGFDVATHAIGDAAVARALDVYEELLRLRPEVNPTRLRIEHFSYADAADFERAAALGVVLVVNPDFVAPDDAGRTMEDARVGSDRGGRVYAFGRLAGLDARLAFGSDYFSAPMAPLIGLYTAVTRRNAAGLPAASWHPENRLAREESLRIMTTLWPAGGDGPRVGRLVAGRPADLVVLTADPMTVDEADILSISAVATLVDGAVSAGALR